MFTRALITQEMISDRMVARVFETVGVSACHFECHVDTVKAWVRIFELVTNRYGLFDRLCTYHTLGSCMMSRIQDGIFPKSDPFSYWANATMLMFFTYISRTHPLARRLWTTSILSICISCTWLLAQCWRGSRNICTRAGMKALWPLIASACA